MNEKKIHGADEDQYLTDLLDRSSAGSEVGKKLAKRSRQSRVDLLMHRIEATRKESAVPAAVDEPGAAEARQLVQAFVAWLSTTKNTVAAKLTRLYWTVDETEHHRYISRRLASYFLTNSRVLPFPLDNPILSSPLIRDVGKRRRDVYDDIALVLNLELENRPNRTIWPSDITPGMEEYLAELDDKIYMIDVRPHTFWQQVDLTGSGPKHTSFLILFVWRVVAPELLVHNRTTSMPDVFQRWLIQRKSILVSMWGERGSLSEGHRKILCDDVYWAERGVSVNIEVLSCTEVTSYENCPPLASVRNFLVAAFHDHRRWFPGTEELVDDTPTGADDTDNGNASQSTMLATSKLVLADGEPPRLEPLDAILEPASIVDHDEDSRKYEGWFATPERTESARARGDLFVCEDPKTVRFNAQLA